MNRTRYRAVRIPKRSGGVRILEIPDDALMAEQRQILAWLCARKLAASSYAHGFVKGRSIASNAAPHVGKKVVIRLDLEDFFPSVTSEMARQALHENGLPLEAVSVVVETCTLENRLPQGAPTSPFLANLVAARLDVRLAGLARKWKRGAYTRYADDLIFSADDRALNNLIPVAERIIRDCGFRVNARKLRIYRSGSRQWVAGVVVNTRPNVPFEVRHNLRAAIHQAREALLTSADAVVDLPRLRGLASYAHSINPTAGARFLRDVAEVERLSAVHRLHD